MIRISDKEKIRRRKGHKEDKNCESKKKKSKTDFEKEFVEEIIKFIEHSTIIKEQLKTKRP